MKTKTIKVGIMSINQYKKRTIAIAKGEIYKINGTNTKYRKPKSSTSNNKQ